jgi:integration host factor subunit beta
MLKSELAERIKHIMSLHYSINYEEHVRFKHTISHKVQGAVDAMLDQISLQIASGGRVEVRGFGSFALRTYTKEREYHHPIDFSKFRAVTKPFVRFKASKEIKELLNP